MSSKRAPERHSSLPGHLAIYPSILPQDSPTELIQRASSEDDGRSTKRPRASKPKVKSGCITCKTRRVKCDETKPHCLRCQKFGRLCDGYSPEPSQARALIQLQPRIPSMTMYGPNTSIHTTEVENRYFRTFSEQSAHELSGYFDSSFWTRLVLQESHQSPAVRHAVIALGALTKSLENSPGPGLKVNVFQATDLKHHEQAVLSYLRAIQELNYYISTSNSPQLRYALISCLLFVCFETFQGSYASCVQQTYGGLKILRSYYMGRPGSRPWIPRCTSAEASKQPKKVADTIRTLQARDGCENIVKDRIMAQHVEEYLEGENSVHVSQGNRSSCIAATPHILLSPVYSVYDPQAHHVDIPGMKSPSVNKNQRSKKNALPSRSHSLPSPSSNQPPIAESPRPPEDAQPISSNASSRVSTPQSIGATSPTAISVASTPAGLPSRKRPLASRSPTPNALQNDLAIEEILIQSFARIDGQGLFFGMTPGIPPLVWDVHKVWHLPIPESFPNLSAAQKCWDFLMDRALQFYRRTLFNKSYAPAASDSPELIAQQHTEFSSQLAAFDKAFSTILDQAIDSNGKVLDAGALVLSLYQRCTKIVLATVLSDSEMIYDSYLSDFQYITRTCNLLVLSQDPLQLPRNPRFSFDVGIIPPLHVVATKCRDPVVRREAIDILFKSPRQEGMWDGVLSARIGRWIAQCEEEGLAPPPVSSDSEQGQQKHSPASQDLQSTYPSPPHVVEEPNHEQQVSGVVLDEHIGRGIAEYGPAKKGVKPLNSVGIRGQIMPRRKSSGKEKSSAPASPREWMVPEENRVQLMIVDFHMPDRYIRVKCQRVLLSESGMRVERETVIAW